MPELPEVETIRLDLCAVLPKTPIKEIEVFYPRVLPYDSLEDFASRVQNHSIVKIERRGKYLLFLLSSREYLVVHLRMTGQLLCFLEPPLAPLRYLSVRITFSSREVLLFLDQRKFGTMYLCKALETCKGVSSLGIEPFDLTPLQLESMLSRRTPVKAILLDQRRIAGLGNIYADEILYAAGIHPRRCGDSLTAREIKYLHARIQEVMTEALKRKGTTIRDYRTGEGKQGSYQNHLLVYGRAKAPCVRCETPISKEKIGGRGSHFCPSCQR